MTALAQRDSCSSLDLSNDPNILLRKRDDHCDYDGEEINTTDQLTSLKFERMMSKLLLALGLCLCLGQLGEGAMGMRDMQQYLARHIHLGEIDVDTMMDRISAAVKQDYQSRTFQVLKLYKRYKHNLEVLVRHNVFTVHSTFQQLNECVEFHDSGVECLEIVQLDKCNIKRRFFLTKEQFNAKVAEALQTPGFDAVPGLVQDVQTLQAMVTEMNLDSEITDVQTFEAFVKNAHELALFSEMVDFSQEMVRWGMTEDLYLE